MLNSPITQLEADDPDAGQNSNLRYTLSPSTAPFAINEMTGTITTTGNFDYDSGGTLATRQYNLDVCCIQIYTLCMVTIPYNFILI